MCLLQMIVGAAKIAVLVVVERSDIWLKKKSKPWVERSSFDGVKNAVVQESKQPPRQRGGGNVRGRW